MLTNDVIGEDFSFKKKKYYGVQTMEGRGILSIKWLKIRGKQIY